MSHRRKNDTKNAEYSDTFSVERFFYVPEGWFYLARGLKEESFHIGPFPTKEIAIDDCKHRYTE